MKKEIKILRILAGSTIGAIYACMYYLTHLEIYSSIICKIILSLVIVYISFNSAAIKTFLKELLIFYLTSFTFGGVTFALLYFISPKDISFQNGTLIGIYPMKMILFGGLMGFILIVLSFKIIKNKIVKKDMICNINIRINNKSENIKALIDTGNFLKEPITGNPVIIVESENLKNVIPVYILNNVEKIINGNIEIGEEFLSKIKIIPFSALGTENGLILGIKTDEVSVSFQDVIINKNNIIVGIYSKKLSKSNRYNALIGLDVIEKKKEG